MGGHQKNAIAETSKHSVKLTKHELYEAFSQLAEEVESDNVSDETYRRAVFALRNGKAILENLDR